MALLSINQNPTLLDTILFDIYTTDSAGNAMNPYMVNQVTIYFIERDYVSSNQEEYSTTIQEFQTSFTYRDAVPIKVYGTTDFPAWLSSDTANAFLTQINFNADGDPEVGHFQLEWMPSTDSVNAREGDYFLCYTWTPIPAGDELSTLIQFYVGGSFLTPTLPSHRTNPKKYPTMLERYTPEMFKLFLASGDVTPDVINRTNLAMADGFTEMETLANQIVDLLDANVIQEAFLPYLANMFRWQLRSDDPTLWRRQVRQAIPLYKKKGTLKGLKEALAESGVEFKGITYYWQLVSKSTWQDGFIVSNSNVFCLSKVALALDSYNFHVYYRANGTATYQEVPLSYVSFSTTPGVNEACVENTLSVTCVTWISTSITLQPGDVVVILYKIAEPADQQIESYIQTLPLADQRDFVTVTFPVLNWNERLIADDDVLFPVICPVKHPFAYPVVYGKIRTEFPYSEQIYNMDTYNGSIRDSNDPCDLDYTFYDTCSCCRSSKISLNVVIEDLSDDRITEVQSIIQEFVPFHTVVQTINYIGLQDDLIIPPIEEIECLIQYGIEDNIIFSQFDFDRLILNAASYENIIKRDMLANANAVASGNDGVGSNIAVTIYCPGVQFGEIGINNENNLLEILSGTNTGQYELASSYSKSTADVLGLTQYPLDHSGFPFRFSNIQYEEVGASVYQDNLFIFSDPSVDFALFPIPDGGSWTINVTSGMHTGSYPVVTVNSNNTLILSGWVGSGDSNFNYQLNAVGGVNVTNGTSGQVAVNVRGRLQTQLIQTEYDVKKGDYVLLGGQQYSIIAFVVRASMAINDNLYIDGYNGGDQVGVANIKILRRLLDNQVGYLDFRGMTLVTTINYETTLGIQNGQNPPTIILDNSEFTQNYLILIGTTYYQMTNINGTTIYLGGPIVDWGLSGTSSIGYTIIWFQKIPTTIQSGLDEQFRTFEPFVDRRGGGSTFVIEQSDVMPMMMRMQLLNKSALEDAVKTQESISYKIIMKDE